MAVPASEKNRPNPLSATKENIQQGLEHFADHCAICHANNGNGDTEFGSEVTQVESPTVAPEGSTSEATTPAGLMIPGPSGSPTS